MFWIQFIGLTLVYLVIGAGITCLIAKYYNKSPWEYLGNNNTWFFVGVGATVITAIIACFNFGPAVLLPENIPTEEQRGDLSYFFSHLLHGTNASAKSVSTKPLPWATGTWFWWKAFPILGLLTMGYACFAFSDEMSSIYRMVKERHEEKERRERERERVEEKAGSKKEKESEKFSFWKLFKVELLSEFLVDFLAHLWNSRKA